MYLICIFYVIWQLNVLNGFSFQLLINTISAIKKNSSTRREGFLSFFFVFFKRMRM